MKLSVIIPLFNAADYIAVQLDALSKQHWSEPWEIIVSDDGSTDGSLRVVERYRRVLPNLRILVSGYSSSKKKIVGSDSCNSPSFWVGLKDGSSTIAGSDRFLRLEQRFRVIFWISFIDQ